MNTVLLGGLVVLVGGALGVPAGVAALLVGLAAIWLRGYLVPYTPRITSQLLGVVPGDRTPHPPSQPESADGDRALGGTADGGETPPEGGVVEDLLTAGVLVADDGSVALDPAFRDAWLDAIETSRREERDPEALAAALTAAVPWVAEADVVTDDGRQWVRLTDAEGTVANETWLSVPAAVADLTAVRALGDRTDLGPRRRTLVAPALRQFLEECPACGAALEVTSPRACCGSPRYVAEGIEAVLGCPECDELVTTFGADPRSG